MSRELQRQVIAAKVVGELVDAVEKYAKAALLAELQSGDISQVRPKDDDGAELGTIWLSKGKVIVEIVDPPAFLKWVRENHPEHIMETVRPAYITRVVADAKKAGEAVTGEGEVIPGLVVRTTDPHLSARATNVAKERVRIALGASLPELMAGEE